MSDRWLRALETIRSKVGEEYFDRWFQPLRAIEVSPSKLSLQAPNPFFRDWIKSHYAALIQEAVGLETEVELGVATVVAPSAPFLTAPAPSAPSSAEPISRPEGTLNSRYTFEQFVVGPSNRFAHAASLAVTESPAKAYNPLFIHGGVGLGKTHLMQAIGHAILSRWGNLRVCYVPSEKFTNELITAIQTRATSRFRERYRSVDVLLIDDIHFIAGKESTQEEFFHTFNTLYDAHKQIILSSDRSPKEIAQLEERLVSRFEWGLVTDIQLPDVETRTAILRKKAQGAGVGVPEEVTNFIAERITTNIRELEGALIRVVAFAQFANRAVDLALTQEVLQGTLDEAQQQVTIERIQQRVAEFFGVTIEELKGQRRHRTLITPRHLAMYLARELTSSSLPEIGRAFGGRNHTTILHALNKIRSESQRSPGTSELLEKLRRQV